MFRYCRASPPCLFLSPLRSPFLVFSLRGSWRWKPSPRFLFGCTLYRLPFHILPTHPTRSMFIICGAPRVCGWRHVSSWQRWSRPRVAATWTSTSLRRTACPRRTAGAFRCFIRSAASRRCVVKYRCASRDALTHRGHGHGCGRDASCVG